MDRGKGAVEPFEVRRLPAAHRRVPRPPGGTEYDEYEGHPLAGVPQEVLDVAREVVLDERAALGGVDEAAALADAVVLALKEAGHLRDHPAGSGASQGCTGLPQDAVDAARQEFDNLIWLVESTIDSGKAARVLVLRPQLEQWKRLRDGLTGPHDEPQF